MVEVKSLRLGNYINKGLPLSLSIPIAKVITENEFTLLLSKGYYFDFSPIVLTKELARDFGFEVIDMGDFWEFNKGDFQLIQFKTPLNNGILEPVFIIHSKTSKHIKVPFVHKLQH